MEKHLANAYACLGKKDSAAYFYKHVLQSPAALNVSFANSRLSEIYAQQGQYKAAYEALFASWQVEKKTYSIEKIQAVGAAVAELQLKEKQLLAAQAEQKRKISQQQLWIGLMMMTLGLGFTISMFLRQRGRRQLLEQEKQILETNQTLLAQQNQLLEKDKTLLAQQKQLAEARETLKTQELERTEAHLKTTKDELDAATRLLQLRNQLIEELEMRLHTQFVAPSDNLETGSPSAAGGEDLYRMKILTDSDWVRFRERFEQAFPGFLRYLKSSFPILTAAETRVFLLYKLKFTNKEVSEALGISPESVYRSRHRLSKKLGLMETGGLDDFIHGFN